MQESSATALEAGSKLAELCKSQHEASVAGGHRGAGVNPVNPAATCGAEPVAIQESSATALEAGLKVVELRQSQHEAAVAEELCYLPGSWF